MRGGVRLAPDPDVAARFIRAAWGDPLPGDVLIWTMEEQIGKREPKKLSYWLENCQGVEQIVKGYGRERNIYAGVGLPGPETLRTSYNRAATSGSGASLTPRPHAGGFHQERSPYRTDYGELNGPLKRTAKRVVTKDIIHPFGGGPTTLLTELGL